MSNYTPTISIIVPTVKGREYYLIQTLNSILNQTYRDFEIIIVAQGYKNDNLSIPKDIRIKKVYNIIKHLPLARNIGVRHSKGKILVFTDDDIITSTNWLEKLVACYSLAGVGGVGGPILELKKRVKGILEKMGWTCLLNHQPLHISRFGIINSSMNFNQFSTNLFLVDTLPGGNMSFCREVIEKVGLFDENYKTYGAKEETDFSLRITEMGYNLILNTDASVVHLRAPNPKVTTSHSPHFQGLIGNRSWYQKYAQNDIYFFMKLLNPNFMTWIGFLIIRFIEMIIHVIFLSKSLSPLWLLIGYSLGYQRAKRILVKRA